MSSKWNHRDVCPPKRWVTISSLLCATWQAASKRGGAMLYCCVGPRYGQSLLQLIRAAASSKDITFRWFQNLTRMYSRRLEDSMNINPVLAFKGGRISKLFKDPTRRDFVLETGWVEPARDQADKAASCCKEPEAEIRLRGCGFIERN